MMRDTHTQFIKKLHESNKSFREGNFKVVGGYVHQLTKLRLQDKLGYYLMVPTVLLRGGAPSTRSCENLEEYVNNYIFYYFKNKTFKYLRGSSASNLILSTKFGPIKGSLAEFKHITRPSIRSAVDKREFWINKAKGLRVDSEFIDYSNSEFTTEKIKVNLTCKKHNYVYKQRSYHHLRGAQGCPFCAKQTIRYTRKNIEKHEEFFRHKKAYLYVVSLSNAEEYFFKVGITSKDSIKDRLSQLRSFYNVKLVYSYRGSFMDMFELEQRFLKEFNNYKYKPSIKFTGHTECLSVNPIEYYYNYAI